MAQGGELPRRGDFRTLHVGRCRRCAATTIACACCATGKPTSTTTATEDAAVFHRIQTGSRTPGNAVFQKGVRDEHALWFDFKRNDDAGNMPRREWYRKAMGFARDEA